MANNPNRGVFDTLMNTPVNPDRAHDRVAVLIILEKGEDRVGDLRAELRERFPTAREITTVTYNSGDSDPSIAWIRP